MTESIILKGNEADRRLLMALAHPDDESFGAPPVGSILHYAQAGVAVHYVCGTRGEVGTVEPALLAKYGSIGAMRTQELLCAAGVLGLSGVHFLDYRDSGMENSPDNQHPEALVQAPVEAVAEKITCLIRRLKPQVVLTFDPTGGYYHPDHIRMHEATTLAFHLAGDPTWFPDQIRSGQTPHQPQKLYYTAFPKGLIKLAVALLPLLGKNPAAMGRNKDLNLKRLAETEQRITTKIWTAPYYEPSRSAAACHASQIGGVPKIPHILLKWMSRYETYTRAVPPPNGSIETDLFSGVD